jgi:hypothetical protein
MAGITNAPKDLWARLRIRRYRAKQSDAAKQAHDSEERLRMAEEGIDPYGGPGGGY